MITHHTQLLQALIDKYGLRSYLEIGVQNPANNFDKVKCDLKIGVDPCIGEYKGYRWGGTNQFWALFPDESDVWFKKNLQHTEPTTFELIFIDGLHHADQVKRDFENSLRCLSDNGFIVIHDVLPENEAGTIVPRQTKVWWGDVYKWAMNIRNYDGIKFITYNIDNGCMVVRKKSGNKSSYPLTDPSWSAFTNIGRTLMNVTDEVTV